MMKKEYINPELEIVKVSTQQMLASSPEVAGEYGGGAILAPEQKELDPFDW